MREKKGNVLVVEDDASARDALRALLSPEYEVFVAADGGSALEILREVPVDAITLEPWLAGIQGRRLLTEIRRANPQARVIIVTAHRLSLWFDDTVREEVFDYLPKPFEPRDLLRSVDRAMVRAVAACLSI